MTHGPRNNRLDFNGISDLDADPEYFEGILPLQVSVIVKAPRQGFGSSLKIHRLADLRLDDLKVMVM